MNLTATTCWPPRRGAGGTEFFICASSNRGREADLGAQNDGAVRAAEGTRRVTSLGSEGSLNMAYAWVLA